MKKNYLPDTLLSMRCTKAMSRMGKYLVLKLCCHLNLNLCKLIKMFSFIRSRWSFPMHYQAILYTLPLIITLAHQGRPYCPI